MPISTRGLPTVSYLTNAEFCPAAPSLTQQLLHYRHPIGTRALFELGVTVGLLSLGWALMWLSLSLSYWLTLVISLPTAGFLVRLFMIQHDCGHGAFFCNRLVNDWIGRALGVFTFTPYDYWKRNHALHHSTSGNLDRRGIGDVLTLTVHEYLSRPLLGRMTYRAYRNPIVMFGIGPAYLFLLQHRVPFEQMRSGWRPWISSLATNAGIVIVASGMIWLVGLEPFVAVQLPVVLLASSMGVWLFYVQHQFHRVVWFRDGDWSFQEAALQGSSYYDLPGLLRWFTANIGVHHVHHLCSRIPFYRLSQVLRDCPQFQSAGRVTFGESVKAVRLALWDETKRELVSFRDAHASARLAAKIVQ